MKVKTKISTQTSNTSIQLKREAKREKLPGSTKQFSPTYFTINHVHHSFQKQFPELIVGIEFGPLESGLPASTLQVELTSLFRRHPRVISGPPPPTNPECPQTACQKPPSPAERQSRTGRL